MSHQALENLTVRAALSPSSFDAENRTVRAIWSTGAGVERADREGKFVEQLSLDPGHVRLANFAGSPVLNSHRGGNLGDVIGVVERAGVDNGSGWADLKFSSRADVEPIIQDVRDGIIRSVSVGYRVSKWAESRDGTARVKRAIDWTPREISLVPIGADEGATLRSATVKIETVEDQKNENRAETNAAIRKVATLSGLTSTFADGLIDRGASVDEARSAAFAEMEKRLSKPINNQTIQILGSEEGQEKLIERMSGALLSRLQPSVKVKDESRPYMGMRLLDMAAELLQVRGISRGMLSPDEVLTRAMATTSDFPNLLTSTGNRALMQAFEAAPNPLKTLARQSTINDFRPKTALKLGPMGALTKVNEAGEVKTVSRTEAIESYGLSTYAEIFSLSRKAIINDDLGAFGDWSAAMGKASSETEAGLLVSLLTANSNAGVTLNDGVALFNAAHGNLAASGAAITTASLSTGRQAMRAQTAVGSTNLINATPKYLLVSPVKETEAETVLAALYPAQVANVNPFANKRYELLVEPRLAGNGWYLFADPALQPVLEYAYLSSAPGPQLAMRQGWDVLGAEFRVILDFGCGVVDQRGAYRNPGA